MPLKRSPLLLAAVLMLPACKTIPVPDDTPPPPVRLSCADIAKQRCQTQPPLWQPPEADSPDAWKLLLPQVVSPMAREIRDCDARLAELQACLDEAADRKLLIWR